MAEYNLGTARGVIEIEYNGNGVTQATRDMRGMGGTAMDSSEKMSRAGGQVATAGAVIAGGLALAVNSAADFEKRLSAVQAVSGASAEEMEVLRDKSLQLGKDTQFSASESASAIEELVKAGISVQDVMNGAADATVALAAAGEVSMPEAAAIASNAMNQFNLAAKDLPGVADAIAGAANASAIDVSDFGYSLSQVGAVANLAGATFDDTATAIALMGNAGIKGSDAGTSLKAMLMNLQPTTEKQKDLMEALGIVTEDGANKFYDAEGNLRSLADISGVLSKALEGQTKQQQQATLETLFGSDAIRAAAIMANNGAEGFDKMSESMGKVTAAEVAATRMDNLQGSIEQLKGSLETLMIQIGAPLLNGVRAVVDGITSFLNVILSLPAPLLEAGTMFAGLLSAGLLLVGGFLKLRGAFLAMRAGLLLFTGPIIAVVAAVAALVAAFVYFYRTNAKFRAFVQQMGAAIKDYIGQAVDFLVPLLKDLGAFLVEAFQKSLPYIQQFGRFLVDAFNASLPTIRNVISFLGELAAMFMERILPVIRDNVVGAVGALVDAFNKVWPAIVALIPAVQDFATTLVDFFNAVMNSRAMEYVISVLKIIGQVLIGTIIPLVLKVGGIVQRVFINVIGNALRTAFNIVRNVLGLISGVIKVITGIITGDWSKAWEGVKQILSGAIGAIGALLKGLLSTAGSILKGLGQVLLAGIKAIPGLLRGAGSLFLAAGSFLMDMFVSGIKSAAGLIEGIASNVWDFVKGLMNGAIGQINAALEFTIDPPGPGKVSINPPDIPALAKGGVLKAPTFAWIAEAGQSEAVVPLSDLWAQMDKIYKAGQTDTQVKEEVGIGNRAASQQVDGKVRDVQVNVHNPVPERASRSVSSVLRNRVVEAGWSA